MLQVLEGVGGWLQALGVPERAQFDTAFALVSYIVGVAGQNASNTWRQGGGPDRSAVLAIVAAGWARLDPEKFLFVRQGASQMRERDDHEQFLAGIDLILAGLNACR